MSTGALSLGGGRGGALLERKIATHLYQSSRICGALPQLLHVSLRLVLTYRTEDVSLCFIKNTQYESNVVGINWSCIPCRVFIFSVMCLFIFRNIVAFLRFLSIKQELCWTKTDQI